MSGLVLWLTYTATALMVVASVVCARAIIGLRWIRALFLLRAAYAATYVVAYLWLIANPERALGWSHVMRGFSIAVIPFVWIVPAVLHRRQMTVDASRIAELREQVETLKQAAT